jgi:16S rRNA (uracil1498-N3)-methyltransferase
MRQFVLSGFPDNAGAMILGEKDFRYLVQVLRKDVGDSIEARLPDGRLCSMRVASIDRKERVVSLGISGADTAFSVVESSSCGYSPAGDARQAQTSPLAVPGASMPPGASLPLDFPRIVLFQWILKGPKMDQVVRQATEAGVETIVPVAGDRCLSRDADSVGEGKTDRWERIVREARQQSGSPVPTRILPPVGVSALSDVWREMAGGGTSFALVLTEAPLARKSLHEYLDNAEGPTAIAVGPEGGMTARELDSLVETGFVCIHFKTNILRAETAALYGIAAVQSALTESEKWQSKE